MPPVFWNGKLPLILKLMMNISCAWAWITGNARNTQAMKERIKTGYEGESSHFAEIYDEVALEHFTDCAVELLKDVDFRDLNVIEMACGTGIVSQEILKKDAAKLVCGDISEYMLKQCRNKITAAGYAADRVELKLFDAGNPPFADNSFDACVSGMIFALFPEQEKTLAEWARVIRPGGIIALSAHAPEHYYEAFDFPMSVLMSFFGYRVEWWPVDEKKLQQMMKNAGLTDIRTRRLTWRVNFNSSDEVFNFAGASSGMWMFGILPPEKRKAAMEKVREHFKRKGKSHVTSDIVLAYARKP